MTSRTSTTKKPGLILLILAIVAAAGIARWCMASGIGVSPDSVIYLSAADSLLAGHGLKPIAFHYSPKIAGGQPLVSFPPTYPLLLSLSGALSIDRLNGARWLHTLLFALNILLLGFAVYLATNGSLLATSWSVLLFLSSPGILEIHMMAWSEPPFILFMLAALILLALHVANPNVLLLVSSALAAGLAMTTRYAGITIVPPMILTVMLLKNKELRVRLKDCLILLGIGTFPLAVWFLRNWMVAGSAANRSFAFHPMKVSDIRMTVTSLLTLWVPFSGNSFLKMILLLLGGALFVSPIVLALKSNAQSEKNMVTNSAIQIFAAVFVITYLLFLYAYNSLMDPAVDLAGRVLSPVFVFGIILGSSVAYRLGRVGKRPKIWWGFLVLGIALISVNAGPAVSFAVDRHADGSGFTSREWADSKSIEYLRTLSPDRTIYSNGVDLIYFLTGRKALRIPAKIDPTGGKSNAEFEHDINAMRNELLQNRAVVIYLNKTSRWYLPSRDELENTYNLPVLIRLSDGVVYGSR